MYILYTAFPDFTLDVSTEVEVEISCDDGQWFHCIAHTSSTVSRSLLILPQQPDTLLSHDYQYSRLNQLECNYMPKRSKVSFEQGFGTCGDIEEEKPLHEKVLFLSVHTLQYFHKQGPTHRATCFAAQVVFVLGASVQPLRQSGKMPRPAPMDSDVEDGSPTTASKEFEAVCFKRS